MALSRSLFALALVRHAAASAAQTPPPACSLDDVAVPFAAPLTLLHTLPAPSAVAEYPFAEVLRAARVRVDFPIGDGATLAARVILETAAGPPRPPASRRFARGRPRHTTAALARPTHPRA